MDLQDLLDEVEDVIQDRSFASTSSVPLSASSSSSARTSGYGSSSKTNPERSGSHKKSVNDLDDLLDMIADDDGDEPSAPVYPRRTAGSTSSSTSSSGYKSTATSLRSEEFQVSGTKRCSTLLVDGESAKRGLNTAFASHCVCSNLRCTDCDFTVVQFLGKSWSSSADYMFFRENVPNEAKLRARMDVAPGSTAYACQCKWLSMDVPTRVDMCRVKWSCAGH